MAYIYQKPEDIKFKVDGILMELDGSYISLSTGCVRIDITQLTKFIEVLHDLETYYKMDQPKTNQ